MDRLERFLMPFLSHALLDFNGNPITNGDTNTPWDLRSALLDALVNPHQPKELVDASWSVVETIEATDDEITFGPAVTQHLLLCCKNALHPLLYGRIKQMLLPAADNDLTEPEPKPRGLVCS